MKLQVIGVTQPKDRKYRIQKVSQKEIVNILKETNGIENQAEEIKKYADKVIALNKEKITKFANLKDLQRFAGYHAGQCYSKKGYNGLIKEPEERTMNRSNMTKKNKHHSCHEHATINLTFIGIPKIIAMFLNNEKEYVTSEKSLRYTTPDITPETEEEKENLAKISSIERELYNKWHDIFVERILELEPNLSIKAADKKANENARYFLSVMIPTNMDHSLPLRQLCYICGFIDKIANEPTEIPLLKMCQKDFLDLAKELRKTGYIDEDLVTGGYDRHFSLLTTREIPKEHFGDTYCTTYKASFAELGQAERHRQIWYEMKLLEEAEFYVPKMLEGKEELKKEYLNDMEKVKHLYPQGMLVQVIERGTREAFVSKLYERLCSAAQLEICDQTRETLEKYVKALEKQNDPAKEEMKVYLRGARCLFGYTCKEPCHNIKGIKLERLF